MSHILLVDDEPLITDSLTYSLKREGFEVRAVGDGQTALQAIQEFQPDLVVLDLMLPGMSGLEVCRRLRAQSSIPVIMLTARSEEMDRVLGLEVGADDYLPKPFSFRELLARIRDSAQGGVGQANQHGTADGAGTVDFRSGGAADVQG